MSPRELRSCLLRARLQIAYLDYCDRQKGITAVSRTYMKIKSLGRPIQDPLGLRVPGGYEVPSNRGADYIGQMGWNIAVRCGEHQSHLKMAHTDNMGGQPDIPYAVTRHKFCINLVIGDPGLLGCDTWKDFVFLC